MIVCICNNISDTEIRDAIADGVNTLDALQVKLPIGSECGSCLNSARDILFECQQIAYSNPGLYYAA